MVSHCLSVSRTGTFPDLPLLLVAAQSDLHAAVIRKTFKLPDLLNKVHALLEAV